MESLNVNLQISQDEAPQAQETATENDTLDLDLSNQTMIPTEKTSDSETKIDISLQSTVNASKNFGTNVLDSTKEYFTNIDVKRFKDFVDFTGGENIDLNEDNQKLIDSTCLCLFLQILASLSLVNLIPRSHPILAFLAIPAYFYLSYVVGVRSSYFKESTAILLNMGIGAVLGMLSSHSTCLIGFLLASFCCVLGVFLSFYFAKNENGVGLETKYVRISGALGAFIGAGTIFSMTSFNFGNSLMLLFSILYSIQLVGIIVDRVNLYSLDLESKNAGPSRLALALPYEAIVRLVRIPLRAD